MFTKQRVDLVEEMVFNYPKGLVGWRYFRIEYGGHAESCFMERSIWLPPTFNPYVFENDLNKCQNDVS